MRPRVALPTILTVLLASPAGFDAVPARAGPVIDVTQAASTGNSSVAECSIAHDPERGIVYLAGHSDRPPNDFSIHLFSSRDGGPWRLTALGPDYDGLGGVRGDPSVAVDDEGTVYVTYALITQGKPVAIACARSTDGGVTFEPPAIVIRELPVAAGDKPYLTLGRNREGQPLVLVTFTRAEGPRPIGIWLAISKDRGRTFGEPVLVETTPPLASYGIAATGPGGEIYVTYTAPNAAQEQEVRLSRSDDGGASFGAPIRLATTGMGFRHAIPAAPHRGIGAVPSLVIDTSPAHPGRIYLTYVSADRVDRADTDVLCRWADPAASLAELRWSEPIPVHRQDRGSNFHPWLSIDPETGIVGVVTHGTRNDVSRRKVETWLSLSADGGNTWAEQRISESSSDVTGQFGFSPFNYLEYIGLYLSKGVAHCAWAGAGGNDPNVLHYLYRAVPAAGVLAARTLEVPAAWATPAAALDAANAGDRVVLDAAGGPYPGSFATVWHVTVESSSEAPAAIDAGGLPDAIHASDGGFGVKLRNLRITGFAETGVRLAARPLHFRPDSLAAPPAIRLPVVMTGVTIEGGTTGVRADGVAVELDSCLFRGQANAVDLQPGDEAVARATRLSRCLLVGRPESPSSVALRIRGGRTEEAPLIEQNTIHGWGTAFRLEENGALEAGSAFRPLLARNLVTHVSVSPLDIVPSETGSIQPILLCNDFWSPSGGNGRPFPGDGAGGNRSVDPRYCGPGETEADLGLRIDSPVSAGNSPCGPVGALDVMCAPAVLEEESRLAAGTRLELTSSLSIPPGIGLRIEPGCRITGSPGNVLFESAGRLDIRGSEAAPVVLDGGRTGIRLDGGSGRFSRLRLQELESVAVVAGPDVDSLEILDSEITGEGGVGLELIDSSEGVVVAGTRVTGCDEAVRLHGGQARLGLGPEEGGGNLFEANAVAVRLMPSSRDEEPCPPGPRLRNNEFRENHHAVVVEPGAPLPEMGRAEPGNNLFWKQEGVAVLVRNPDCGPVPALGNRFGPGDFGTAGEPPGSVDWSGWLVECPPEAAGAGRPFCRILAMPNPSGESVHLQFDLEPQTPRLTVDIFDLQGRARRRLFEGPVAPLFSLDWDGHDDGGRRIAAGVYWVVAADEVGNRVSLRVVRLH